MTSPSPSAMRERATLAADGGLLTAGTFALLTAIGYALVTARGIPLGAEVSSPLDAAIVAFAGLLGTAASLAGPGLAWWLHGRKITRTVLLGALGGFFVSGVLVFAVSLLASVAGMLARGITTSEFVGPLIVLSVLSVAAIVAVLWLLTDGMRDLRKENRRHAALDIARVAAAVAVVLFAAAVAIYFRSGDGPEAIIFMLAESVFGAAVVFSADIVSGYLDRRIAHTGAVG